MSIKLHEVISQIDDKYILEAANTIETRKQGFNSKKWLVVFAACLIPILFIAPAILIKAGAEDPHWYKTHAEASSFLEAERIFGKNLTIEKLLLSDIKYPYEFSSTLEWEEGGSLEDKSSWKNLDTHIIYFHEYKPLIDMISLRVFFNNNDSVMEHYESIFDGKEKTIVINGIELTYVELKEKRMYPYTLIAKFVRDDYICYFSSSSRKNFKLNWRVLEQYLKD